MTTWKNSLSGSNGNIPFSQILVSSTIPEYNRIIGVRTISRVRIIPAKSGSGEVSDRGVYISGVYTGYRKVPHFSIAVNNLDPVTGEMWVLRATIDALTLQHFIDTIKTDASDDLFLVD